MTSPLSQSHRPVWIDPRAIALLFAASLTTMANATISPALALLEQEFASHPYSALLIRLLVPAPSLSIILCAAFAGLAVDRYGRRRMLLAGVALFVISGTAGLYLTSLESIFASRLFLGVAVAMIMTAQTALIGDYFAGTDREALTGLQISARNFGGFVCISLAGWLALYSPRLPFAIYGIAAFLLPLMWMVIKDVHRKSDPMAQSRSTDVQHDTLRWQWRLFGLCLLQMTTSMGFFVVPTQMPFFLAHLGYESASMTGQVMGTLTLFGGVAAIGYKRLQALVGYQIVYGLGYGLMACGFGLLPAFHSPLSLYCGAMLIGVGFALVMPTFVVLALKVVPASHRGRASGFLTMSVFVGQLVSPFASLWLIQMSGYETMLALNACIFAVMFAVAFFWLLVHHATRKR